MRHSTSYIRGALQIVLALVIIATIYIQFVYGLDRTTDMVNYTEQFFTYFTVISNAFVAAILFASAYELCTGKPFSQTFNSIRGAAIFSIITTGVVYALFLRGPASHGAGPPGAASFDMYDSLAWATAVLHYVVPPLMFLDWVAFPPKQRLRWSVLFSWLGFALVYVIFVEIAGYFTNTYPYFFLDPITLHGYKGVIFSSLVFIPFLLVFATLVLGSNNVQHWWRARQRK